MQPGVRKYLFIESPLFVSSQGDEDLDAWRVGGDCAGWFYTRLLTVPAIRKSLEPVMEDWGWTFSVEVEKARVWINVWSHLQVENRWVLGVEAKKTFPYLQHRAMVERAESVVSNALESLSDAEPQIRRLGWFGENPVDLVDTGA